MKTQEPVHKVKKTPAAIAMFAMLLFNGSALTLTGCNTVEGAGDDIEAAGDSISDTARDAKD